VKFVSDGFLCCILVTCVRVFDAMGVFIEFEGVFIEFEGVFIELEGVLIYRMHGTGNCLRIRRLDLKDNLSIICI
jgi:hypothetical protein